MLQAAVLRAGIGAPIGAALDEEDRLRGALAGAGIAAGGGELAARTIQKMEQRFPASSVGGASTPCRECRVGKSRLVGGCDVSALRIVISS